MWLASAMVRQTVASAVFTRRARNCGDSPATTRVQPGGGERAGGEGMPGGLLGISCRCTWQVARIGTPVVENRL